VAVALGQQSLRNEVSAGTTNALPVANSIASPLTVPLSSSNDSLVPSAVTANPDEASTADSPALFLPPSRARQGQMLTTPSSGSSQQEGEDQGNPAPMANPAAGEGTIDSGAESYPLQRGELVLDPAPDLSSPFDLGLIDKALAIDAGSEASSVPWWVWPMLGSVAGAVWLTRRRQQEEEYQALEEQALRELLL